MFQALKDLKKAVLSYYRHNCKASDDDYCIFQDTTKANSDYVNKCECNNIVKYRELPAQKARVKRQDKSLTKHGR